MPLPPDTSQSPGSALLLSASVVVSGTGSEGNPPNENTDSRSSTLRLKRFSVSLMQSEMCEGGELLYCVELSLPLEGTNQTPPYTDNDGGSGCRDVSIRCTCECRHLVDVQ